MQPLTRQPLIERCNAAREAFQQIRGVDVGRLAQSK